VYATTVDIHRKAVAAIVLVAAIGCQDRETPKPVKDLVPNPDTTKTQLQCEWNESFAGFVELQEASGAVYVAGDDPFLLVVGDSGTNGQFVELDPETGSVLARGNLPLDSGASDDIEGLSMFGKTFYGVTSGGWVREWDRIGQGKYVLVHGAYPIAQQGLQPPLLCKTSRMTNCAQNYEGLCLQSVRDDKCVGYIASKQAGKLYCLMFRKEHGSDRRLLSVDPANTISVSGKNTLTGCHFSADGKSVWAGTNFFGFHRVYQISFGQGGSVLSIEPRGSMGRGFQEALAIGPNRSIYRFSDVGSSASLIDRYDCR